MEKKSLMRRFVIPFTIVIHLMVFSSIIYLRLAWRIDNESLKAVVALISSAILFVSIGFGTLLIYPMAFFRGANAAERIIACLITPLIWNIKEMIRVSEFFTFGETLYYGLNTDFLLTVFAALGQMGLCEIICRWRLNKRGGEPVKVFSPAPVVSIVTGLAALYFFLIWGLGVHFFYIYVEGYKALFI